eukprot:3256221-Alexandrium_andersonii.AAC.1
MATAASLVQPTSWRMRRSSRSTEHCVTRQMASWRAAGWSVSGQRRRAAYGRESFRPKRRSLAAGSRPSSR